VRQLPSPGEPDGRGRRARVRVDELLDLFDLGERGNDKVGGFSKGMRQRLALARTLLHEPQIVFLDEPTSGLDPAATREVHQIIQRLRAGGRTVFLATHNLAEAERLCDRVAVFKTHLRVVDTPGRLRRQVYGRQVVFHLAGAAEPYLALARALPFVSAAEAEAGKLILTLDDPEGHNPDIVRALVAAGADIQFVGELRYSLEDVYLQLVKDDATPAT